MDFDLIEKFAPIYHYDSDEQYFPIDYNSFAQGKYMKHVVNVHLRHINSDTIWIYYICFYTHKDIKTGIKNNCFSNCCLSTKSNLHCENQFEIVILEIDNSNEIYQKMKRVCFCPHNKEEYFWIGEKDLSSIQDKNNSDKIHVYVSKGKHAAYPLRGVIWRNLGFENDCNNDDIILLLRPILLILENLDSMVKEHILKFNFAEIPEVPLESIRKRNLFRIKY